MIWNRQNPYLAEVISRKLLSGNDSNKEVIHFEIALGDSKIKYEPGDSLGVIPLNNKRLVKDIIDRLGFNPLKVVESYNQTIFQLLESRFEILTPTNRLISYISKNINHKELNELIENEDKNLLSQFKYGKDVLDFLNLDSNLKIDLNIFLSLLKPLQHRAYSISSSMLMHPEEVHLTISTQRWENNTRKYGGVCSTFLADDCSRGSKIKIFLIPNKNFRLPADHSKPIIMIGPGTGIAPFIAFLQERKYLQSLGKNWLFYGAQYRKMDHIYEKELIDFQEKKILSKLDVAFSRDQLKKIYVQNRIYESRSKIFQWIEDGAYLYVCGDKNNMAVDVNSTLQKIIQEQLNCSEHDSILYIKNLKKEKRYLLDVY